VTGAISFDTGALIAIERRMGMNDTK